MCSSPSRSVRASEDLVIGLFADQPLDSPDHPLVGQAAAFKNPSVRWDQFSGRDQDHVGWFEVVDQNFDIDAIRHDQPDVTRLVQDLTQQPAACVAI